MKLLLSFFKTGLAIALFIFLGFQANAQSWSSSNLYDQTYRSGNTGIGITTPFAKLHLYNSNRSTENILLRLHRYDGGTFAENIWDIDIDKSGSYVIGNTPASNISGLNRFAITNSGNVGIGTITPGYKLQVNGDTDIKSDLYVGNRIGVGTQSPDQHLTIFDSDTPTLRFEREGSKWDYEIYTTGGGNMVFRGGGNGTGSNGNGYWGDKMVITGKGYVGIGMSNVPSSMQLENANGDDYLLYVKGGILTEEVKVETGWCDYVFEEDYELLPLEGVEAHIQEKGHLHNTPSAKVIEEEGLELKSMTVNQQEKIEEVFLHLIEMNKQLIELRKENELLKSQISNPKK